MNYSSKKHRREILSAAGKLGTIAFVAGASPRVSVARDNDEKRLPNLPCGIVTGDVGQDSATIWTQADRASQMLLEVSRHEDFKRAKSYAGPNLLMSTDFTGRITLRDLKPGTKYFARVTLKDLDNPKQKSAPNVCSFTTADRKKSDIRFAWSGDTAGQGYGIDYY